MSEIRRCEERDIPALMSFIHEHWAKDHVLSRHRPLMDWQHADPDAPGLYNWMLASDAEGIQGILGFIPASRFDPGLKSDPLTWLALWKVRPEPRNRTLGLQLLNALMGRESAGTIAVLGINPAHPPMYRALGFRTGEMEHHFLCNPGKRTTLVAAPAGFSAPVPGKGRAQLTEVDAAALRGLSLDSARGRLPRKTPVYFANRFFGHPVYTYKVYLARLDGRPSALVAIRVAAAGSARALRIVDFAGDEEALAESGPALGGLMRDLDCEHADLWQYGIAPEVLERCGFRRVRPDGDVVVPNYFEPFLRKNARIEFAIRCAKDESLAIFRADGDQDRPNSASPSDAGT